MVAIAAALSPEAFLARWREWSARYAAWVSDRFDPESEARVAAALQSRCKTLADLTSPNGPGAFLYAEDEAIGFDEKAVNKFLRKGEPSGLERLREIRGGSPASARTRDEDPGDLRARIQDYEARLIVEALRRADWDRVEAARSLALPLRTLARRMKALGIKRAGYEVDEDGD